MGATGEWRITFSKGIDSDSTRHYIEDSSYEKDFSDACTLKSYISDFMKMRKPWSLRIFSSSMVQIGATGPGLRNLACHISSNKLEGVL